MISLKRYPNLQLKQLIIIFSSIARDILRLYYEPERWHKIRGETDEEQHEIGVVNTNWRPQS